MKSFDPTLFRRHFPALQANGIYLDSAATALKPQCVIDCMTHYYSACSSNVHRSQHAAAMQTTQQFERARQQVADALNADSTDSIIWTKGTTEAINLVAWSYVLPMLAPGDEILVSEAEHHANLIPWMLIAQQSGAKIVKLPLTDQRIADIDHLENFLTSRTRVLALGQMSNVTGGCPNLKLAIEQAHRAGAVVVVDGAQGMVHCPPDVQALDIDFYAFSGHKLFGPTGIGVLYAKSDLLPHMRPWQGGGKMISQVSFDGFSLQPPPHCFEAGTPNIAGVLGLGAVFEWLADIDLSAAERYACSLADRAEQQLAHLPGWQSYRVLNSSLLAFNFEGIHHADLATLLAEQEIAIRAGQHCAQPLMQALGVSGTLRASFAPYNSEAEVETFCEAVEKALRLLD